MRRPFVLEMNMPDDRRDDRRRKGGQNRQSKSGRGQRPDRDRSGGGDRGRRNGSDQERRGGSGQDRRGDGSDRRGSQRDIRAQRGTLRPTPGGDLPRWVKEEIQRVTPKDRREPTMRLLADAALLFADSRYPQALPKLREAKKLSSRTATIRELLGLTAYRTGNWQEGLRELRTFRRLTGDTTHMAVEMDCLRALDRPGDVEKVWNLFHELGGGPAAEKEMSVVYASFLLDQGRPKDAWRVTSPKRIEQDAREHDLRRWYVAARAASALGDYDTADQLAGAIEERDVSFPGLEELRNEIAEGRTG